MQATDALCQLNFRLQFGVVLRLPEYLCGVTTSEEHPPQSKLDRYLKAAERPNTNQAYQSGVEHFERVWKGLLPATSTSVAEYLAHFAGELSNSTLRQRTAALANWHRDQGFTDPTKSSMVRQVLKGARALHPSVDKRAKPFALNVLEQVDLSITRLIASSRKLNDRPKLLQYTRDRAMVLVGFWRGFRSEDLVALLAEDVDAIENEGMTIHLNRGKTDKNNEGRDLRCPALSRLCPVTAYLDWTRLADIQKGPVFQGVHVTGKVSGRALHVDSVNRIFKAFLERTGVEGSNLYSSHSLRRGFAGWARGTGWTLEQLMDYVGWKNLNSALRYLEVPPSGLKEQFERGLPPAAEPSGKTSQAKAPVAATTGTHEALVALVRVKMLLSKFTSKSRGLQRARTLIEKTCFARYNMKPLDKDGIQYELAVPYSNADDLDETMYALLDEMFAIADANQAALEVDFYEPKSRKRWS